MSEITLDDRGRALENEYFHRREQELLAKMREKISAETSVKTEFACPKCDGTLHQTDYENIKIDVCDKCHGVWLDAGELAQALHKDGAEKGWFGKLFN